MIRRVGGRWRAAAAGTALVVRASAVGAFAVGAFLVWAMWGPGATPASAHGGAGAISLVDVRPTGDDTVALEVCVTFTLDRDQAETARVTVRAEGPDNAEVDAARMDVGDQPGLRTAELALPRDGSWIVVVESTFPPAELAVPVTVGGADRSSIADTVLDPTQTAASCQAESSEPPTWLVAGLGSAAAVAVFGGLLLVLRRATSAPPAEG